VAITCEAIPGGQAMVNGFAGREPGSAGVDRDPHRGSPDGVTVP
jgi:hypothetical protein